MGFTVLVAVFVLGVLIFVHELGHFLAAKLVDVQVLRFSIGLGKPLFSRFWGETEYSLSAIPFGGYVKMAGDDPAEGLEADVEEEQVSTDPARHFENKRVWQRFLIIFAGPLANFLLAVLLYQGIFYFKGAESFDTTVIEAVESKLLLPGMEGIRAGSKILSVNGHKVANWYEVSRNIGDAESAATVLQLEGGEGEGMYTVSVPTPGDTARQQLQDALVPFTLPLVGGVIPGKPAKKAGIERGDLILEIDGQPVRSWLEMTRIIHAKAEVPLSVAVEREGRRFELEVTPEKGSIPQSDGTFKEAGLIGIQPQYELVSLSFTDAVRYGATNSVYMTLFISKSLADLVTGLTTRRISFGQAKDVLGGPVMIGQMAGEWARSGRLWSFMAVLSINLAILNLLPIPVLDGGHLLFLLIEVVRFGRPLSAHQRMRMIQVGLIIVFGLMILATANDLRRILGL
ncbi:MAG: RIP metalloprotease RseP [Candidatus Glassbacteria bacterium RIFCSPLOWO2_12_FULL_58_11]|uniref:Zinc metalloprotease n=1 Tax=Candidatus Glassbacteria bacterium RIFCSPLOWO2_12_FULL_58_11 TaxID=1817867 RepID=A0A1F5YW62_9BACT|nr:MAG: RIP metalloprotease RseP [Candidatus Glassbacteria bacterium RIFCSPLOWO2_12_FULL_58_11]